MVTEFNQQVNRKFAQMTAIFSTICPDRCLINGHGPIVYRILKRWLKIAFGNNTKYIVVSEATVRGWSVRYISRLCVTAYIAQLCETADVGNAQKQYCNSETISLRFDVRTLSVLLAVGPNLNFQAGICIFCCDYH